MGFKGFIAATAAIALMATPTIASAAQAEVAPASEMVSGMQQSDGPNVAVIVLAVIAAGLGFWFLLKGDDDDDGDLPVSP